MQCNCAEHRHSLKINNVFKIDPTRTLTIRNRFEADARRRFRQLTKAIWESVAINDAFGLNQGRDQFQILDAAPHEAFAFPRSVDKTQAFLAWLQEQYAQYIFTGGQKGLLVHGAITAEGARDLWASTYIESAYQKGIARGRAEMRAAGMEIPSFESAIPGQENISMAFNQPIHTDRVAALYLRTYNDLKGITNSIDQQMSRIFASGIADGKNPKQLARILVKVVEGGGGDLGITDVLGRYIPAKRRAEMLARTEVIRAHHEANIAEYELAGVQGVTVRAEWLTAGDDRVCAFCLEMATKGPYTLKEIRTMIPAHPQCRCVAIPYVGDLLNETN